MATHELSRCESQTEHDVEFNAKTDGDDLDLVFKEVGEFNPYQIWKFVLLFIPIVLSAVYAINFIVTASNLDYRCRIPDCDAPGDDAVFSPSWLLQAIPYENGRMKKCLRYATNATIAASLTPEDGKCPAKLFSDENVVKCEDFVYKSNEQRLIQAYGIFCEDAEYKLALVGTVYNLGRFISMPFTGILSDKFGRVTVLVIGMTANSIFGVIQAFAPSYYTFLLFTFFGAISGTCTYLAAFVLSVEWVSSKYRVLSATATSAFYPLGEVLLGVLAMNISSLRTLILAMYLPGLIVAFYYWLIPESVRWLVVTGRHQRALQTLKLSAKSNGVELSDRAQMIVYEKCKKALEAKEAAEAKNTSGTSSFSMICRSGVIPMRLAICSVCWIAVVHAYYGMSVSSTKIEGDDNKYMSFIVVVCAEIPAVIITYFVTNRLGRRITLCGGMTISGLAIIASAFVPPEQTLITRVLFFGGMMSIAVAFTILYIYTAELWPTSIRNTLMNVCSMVGRFGGMAAPLTPLLAYVFPALPAFVYGGVTIVAALLVLLLPETLNKNLPDTIEEAIAL